MPRTADEGVPVPSPPGMASRADLAAPYVQGPAGRLTATRHLPPSRTLGTAVRLPTMEAVPGRLDRSKQGEGASDGGGSDVVA